MQARDALDQLIALGKQAYGSEWLPSRIATAPGRLELLGNHVDYNGGLVLAGAIDRAIQAVAAHSAAAGPTIRLFAPDVSTEILVVDALEPAVSDAPSTTPADYLAGIVLAMREANVPYHSSLEVAVRGDVPVGFGMSSSAALCVSLTMLLAEGELAPPEIVRIARRAEHITGAPVGSMDQSASVAGNVILFDGATGAIERLSPNLGDYVFAVANSGVHHALSESSYPVRVRESEEALSLIRENTDLDVDHLGQISVAAWNGIESRSASWLSPVLRARVRHVVTEVDRVGQGIDALNQQDWHRFGSLMTASGRSSSTDYDISHPAVEELVGELKEQPGVLGARMMGGGEGGPALALLHREAVEPVRKALASSFFTRHGLDPKQAFEVCAFGPGATEYDFAIPE